MADLNRANLECAQSANRDLLSFPLCKDVVSDHFEVKVDYDGDIVFHGGCHGKDMFFDDDPISLWFTSFKNGDVYLSVKPHDVGDFKGYLTADAGEFFEVSGYTLLGRNIEWGLPKEFPVLFEDVAFKSIKLDGDFYKCIAGNSSLTGSRREAVDRFFEGIKRTFPKEFGGL